MNNLDIVEEEIVRNVEIAEDGKSIFVWTDSYDECCQIPAETIISIHKYLKSKHITH